MPVDIRMLTTSNEIALGSDFFKSVWGGEEDVVPVDIAIASGHAGGYFSGAFSDGELVAASYGFLGNHEGMSTIHSHVTASSQAGAGFALKQHQMQWARERGVDAITWTFDPLVRRNCVFNLDKLGAIAVEYLENFYGVMNDLLNQGDQSDRLFALWSTSPLQLHRPPAGNGDLNTSPVALAVSEEGTPVALAVSVEGTPVAAGDFSDLLDSRQPFAVYLPADIEALRASNPSASRAWRGAVREVLQPSFASGAIIRRMMNNRAALLVEWPIEGAK